MVKVGMSLMEKARKKTKSDQAFTLVVLFLVLIMFAIVFVNTYVLVSVKIKGASMVPTMKDGDVLVVNRYKEVKHGSIVVISGEKNNGEWIIKRVIAMEGDTVKIEPAVDGVFIKYKGTDSFVKLDEPYAQGVTGARDWREKTLEEDEIFYLGDNREYSHDSRNADFSTCKESQIVGVVTDWSMATSGFGKFIMDLFYR